MIRKVGFALLAVVVVYSAYLAWRVAEERRDVGAKVDAMISAADPDELSLSPTRIAMLLRVEDPTFRTNKGIDLSTPGAGLTTLSQGLGKTIFFDDFEPGLAKVELMALTRFALYPEVSKERTLQAFVASAYLGSKNGRPVIGFADGARAWFGKPLSRLSDREYLALVAMLPAPNGLNPIDHAAANAERIRRIERLLANACRPTGLRDVMLQGCA